MAFESGNIPKETLDYLASKKVESENRAGVGLLLLLFIGAVIIVVCMVWGGDSKTDEHATSGTQDAPTLPYNAEEILAQAKAYMASKDYKLAEDEFEELRPADAKRFRIQGQLAKAKSAATAADAQEQRAARLAYVQDYERSLLSAGMDATVRATGSNASTLKITFVLVNRPFVYRIENNEELRDVWRLHGFTNVVLSNGYDRSWSYKLK